MHRKIDHGLAANDQEVINSAAQALFEIWPEIVELEQEI